jgi:four helix bundle protein
MKENNVKTKSYEFAIRIVNLFKWLSANKNEHVLSKQLLRCGTSIGANVEEACGSYSDKEYAAKIQISFKEALETRYWLRLMHDTGFIETSEFGSIFATVRNLFVFCPPSQRPFARRMALFAKHPTLIPSPCIQLIPNS